ncbi:MAG: O-antigen ligase family protein [Candidatus Magasanikbacteria bacterium]|nr:O-antigen ligase family protein [Candidatus Magasanikbacteria bacterium]
MHHRFFALLLIISPLVIWTNLPYPYSFPRWIYLATLCTLWAVIITYDVWRKKVSLFFSTLDYAFFAFITILGIATIHSVDPWSSLWGSMERGFGFALWPELAIAYIGLKLAFEEKKSNYILWRGLICTVIIASLWGVAQKFIPAFSQTFSGSRIGGTLGNAIFFGSYLSLAIGGLSYFISSKIDTKFWRMTASAAIVLAFIVLLLTQTRGPLLGLLAGVCVFLFTYALTIPDVKKRIYVSTALIGATTVTLLFGIWLFQHNYISTTTATTRFINWKMAAQGFLDKPVLGWGVGQYARAADKHFDSTLSEFSIDETHADKPHNYFIELAVTSGALGLLSYFFLIVVTIYCTVEIYHRHEFSRVQLSLLLGIFATSFTQNLTAFETHGSIIRFVFTLALIASHQKKYSYRFAPFLSKFISIFLLCASVIISFFGAWIPTAHATALETVFATSGSYSEQHHAIQELTAQLFSTAYTPDYFTAISYAVLKNYWQQPTVYAQLSDDEKKMQRDDMTQLMHVIPQLENTYQTNATWNLLLGNTAYQIFVITHDREAGNIAEKLYIQAHLSAPNRQEALIQLAQLLLIKNETNRAIELLTEAINLDLQYPTPTWNRGLALFIAHKPQEAWSDISHAISLDVQKPNEQIAQYIYTQLLNAKMETEAADFERYFDGT